MKTITTPRNSRRTDTARVIAHRLWQNRKWLYYSQAALAEDIDLTPRQVTVWMPLAVKRFQEAHPGYGVTYSRANGYGVRTRAEIEELRMTRGRIRAARTKQERAACELDLSENTPAMRQLAMALRQNVTIALEPMLASMDEIIEAAA